MTKKELAMKPIIFQKMHGLGNDFVVIDSRDDDLFISTELVKSLADRHCGVGFDQLAVIYKSKKTGAAAKLDFWNCDGSKSATCGNATRCVAKLLMDETKSNEIKLMTSHAVLTCKRLANDKISVNMGQPQSSWKDIPLTESCDTLHLPLEGKPVATNIGNPHCTFFVEDIKKYNLEKIGTTYENHRLFKKKTNVQIAQVLSPKSIRVRVWERGVGVTMASGSSACAVAFAAKRLKLVGKKTEIILDGGKLDIELRNDEIWMSGPTAHIFQGTLSNEFFASMIKGTG
jgi:diaminopimelate epimerase